MQEQDPLSKVRGSEIFEELKVEPVDEKLGSSKSNWLRHVTRMCRKRMPEVKLNYRCNGR